MARLTLADVALRVTALELQQETIMATAQEILDLANQANAQLDLIADRLASQITESEATAIRDSLTALVAKVTQLVAG